MKNKSNLLFSIVILLLYPNLFLGQKSIVDKAIEASGMEKMRNAEASFTFRDYNYKYERQNGRFTYTRIGKNKDSTLVRDVYSNDGFTRYVSDTVANLTEKRKKVYVNSVNSVIYFAFLPLWLQDSAVVLENKGKGIIKGKVYHKVRVTFQQEGGGDDFEDVFYYWFDVKEYSMDYMAYKYNTGKGGMRFREAYNRRKIEGVIIQDYRNFKPKIKGSVVFDKIEEAFKNDKLEVLLFIELKNVIIMP